MIDFLLVLSLSSSGLANLRAETRDVIALRNSDCEPLNVMESNAMVPDPEEI